MASKCVPVLSHPKKYSLPKAQIQTFQFKVQISYFLQDCKKGNQGQDVRHIEGF